MLARRRFDHRGTKRVALFIVLFITLAAASGAVPAFGSTTTTKRYVSPAGTDTNNNCLSLANPCKTIGHALFVAAPGDQIVAAAGTYAENLTINKNILITGASLSSTVIDGGAAARVVGVSSGIAATLSELRIQNGKLVAAQGAGISNAGTLTLRQVMVVNNTSTGGATSNDNGGGIWNSGTLTVQASFVARNHADNDGGGIYNQSGKLTLTNSVISGNTAGSNGGGLENEAVATLTHTDVTNNSAGSGGGLDNPTPGTLTLSEVTITGNSSTFLAGGAGGIWQRSTKPVTLTNVTFRSNSAPSGIGGGFLNQDSALLTDVTFDSNFADNGGGMENQGLGPAAATLINVTFSGNGASLGGALFVSNGTESLTNVTFSGNTGSAACALGGSTICNLGGTVIFKNTIVANSLSGANCYNGGTFIDNGHNLESGNSCGFSAAHHDLINIDPLLGPLQNNGGYTDTLALLKGSPAINKGTNTGCPAKDQRGHVRITATDPTCDIGAYEFP